MRLDPIATAKPPFVYWVCLWAAGIAFGSVAILVDILDPNDLTPPGRDFSNLYTAGKLITLGFPEVVFNPTEFRIELYRFLETYTVQNYSYPPHALFLAAPFGLLPYPVAFAFWTILGATFFYWAARPMVPFAPILTILTPAAAINVWAGHYGFVLGGLWLLYFRLFKDHPVKAGIVASILTFKPHMGLFVGLTALSSRKVLATAICGTLALVAASAIAFGGWPAFIQTTFHTQVAILNNQFDMLYFRMMPSAYTAFGRNEISATIQLLFAVSAGLMVIKKADAFTLATATFIIVPYVFVYDMTVVCLGFALLLWQYWPRLGAAERAILTAAFLAPCLTIIYPPLVPAILLAALYVQVKSRGIV